MAEVTSSGSEKGKVDVEEKVQRLNEMFKDRYTDSDEGYVQNKANGKLPPPCVTNWYSKPARNDRRGGGRDRYHNNNSYGNQRYSRPPYHGSHYHRGRGSYGNRQYRPY